MQNIVFTNATLATMASSAQPYGLMYRAALVVAEGLIRWCGPMTDLPSIYTQDNQHCSHRDLGGMLITPALIDCHTHLVYAGNRAREFELRLQGASYQDLARAGGGILSTVTATRAASEAQLLAEALPRVDAFIAEGVATLEIKSGYGLSVPSELKMLRVARRIAQLRPIRVKTTFLGAHALPKEYAGAADNYIDEVCVPALEAAAAENLVDAVDGFCENIGFSTAQIIRVFAKAKSLGLHVKLHAEQISNMGASALAAAHGALSADHLEYLDPRGVAAMAQAGSVAVLLPGAFYTLGETQLPPVAALRQAAVPMAVATDCNPGSSPLNSLLLAMNMASTLFKLTPEEALLGTTRHAAQALGLTDTGVLSPGLRADLAIWNVGHPAELAYGVGTNPLSQRVFGGAL